MKQTSQLQKLKEKKKKKGPSPSELKKRGVTPGHPVPAAAMAASLVAYAAR